MKITRENINVIKKLEGELDVLMADATRKIANAKANNKNIIKWTKNGKEIECEELHLWVETLEQGANCDAYKALANKYPEAFEAVRVQNEKAFELNVYAKSALGINSNGIRICDIVALCEAVFDLLITEALKPILDTIESIKSFVGFGKK